MLHRAPVLLAAGLALLAAGCAANYAKVHKTKRTEALAVTAEQLATARSLEKLKGEPLAQLGGYLDAANAARLKLATDPENTLWRSDYNFAVARIIDIMGQHRLAPWDAPIVAPSASGSPWRLHLTPPFPQPQYHPRHFDFTPSDRFKFTGVNVGDRVTRIGLGSPLVVIGRDLDYVQLDQFAQGKHVYYGLTALIQFNGRNAEIQLVDPLDRETVALDRHTYPLSGDYQGPLSLALAELEERRTEILGLFKPQDAIGEVRLARLQPYNPRKIPVLFVHGLGNSPATWSPLIEFLRGDPDIRANYQFWMFSYPSGLPYSLSAAFLRQKLGEIRRQYPGIRDIVVVGHSMGGMISRLLITDSGMKIWNAYFPQPPEKTALSAEARSLISKALIFPATPGIARVIFVSPSHRGSDKAIDFWGRVGAAIVGNPLARPDIYREAYAAARPEAQQRGRNRLPNGIDTLDPENLFVRTVDSIPPKPRIPFHTLLGDRGKGGFLDQTKPTSTDGLVPYWSGHLEGAESERIIPSGHWSHLHPLGMAEIKRILYEHLRH